MLEGIPPLTLTYDDVLLRPLASDVLPHEVSLKTKLTERIELGIPLMSAAMDTVTESKMAIAMAEAGGIGVIHRNMPIEIQVQEVKAVKAAGCLVAAAVGTSDGLERAAALLEAGADAVIVDTAHGHSKGVLQTVRAVRKAHPDANLIGGNVATAEGTTALIEAGVDAVKVGVGPGSICTTRVVAGVGVAQLSAVAECAKAARTYRVPIIADGGVRTSGDIVKAIAAGASTVMLGSALAGTDEAPGELVIVRGTTWKSYRGMGSLGAMTQGSRDRYFQEGVATDKLVPEGVSARVPYRGKVGAILAALMGGLRSGMGYTGSATIKHLQENARFVRITNAGLRESRVHDVTVTDEEPVR
jgi:IMP dehydrogenase